MDSESFAYPLYVLYTPEVHINVHALPFVKLVCVLEVISYLCYWLSRNCPLFRFGKYVLNIRFGDIVLLEI